LAKTPIISFVAKVCWSRSPQPQTTTIIRARSDNWQVREAHDYIRSGRYSKAGNYAKNRNDRNGDNRLGIAGWARYSNTPPRAKDGPNVQWAREIISLWKKWNEA
jgi:hypothetical protein